MLTNHKHTKYNDINEVVGLEGSLLLWHVIVFMVIELITQTIELLYPVI